MAIIAEFDTDPTLITIGEKHHAWHMFPAGAHGFPSRNPNIGMPGSGVDFFQFHKQLMNQFFAWNNVHHTASPGDIAPWNAIPAELKVPTTGWPNPWPGLDLVDAEAKINANPGIFTSEDAFGIHVETTVHSWIHGAVANCPAFALPANEKDIISRLHSFQSTWFYKIHGLVQFWRDRWLSQHPAKSVVKDVHDFGTLPKQHHLEKVLIKEFKEHAKEFKEHQKEFFKEHAKEFKEKDKDKDLVENPGGFNHGDPAVFAALQVRVAELEKTVQQGQTFIKAEERPAVGQPVVKPTKT